MLVINISRYQDISDKAEKKIILSFHGYILLQKYISHFGLL